MQRLLLGPGSHLALAILCSKVFIPLKLPVAMALTPYVHKHVTQRLINANSAAAAAAKSRASGGPGGGSGSGGAR